MGHKPTLNKDLQLFFNVSKSSKKLQLLHFFYWTYLNTILLVSADDTAN